LLRQVVVTCIATPVGLPPASSSAGGGQQAVGHAPTSG
jgi:hypothetical protein